MYTTERLELNQKISVHSRINKVHPDVLEDDVLAAWRARVKCQMRVGNWPPQYVALGFDQNGRALQMVATYDPAKDEVLIFHAMEATKKVKQELGLMETRVMRTE